MDSAYLLSLVHNSATCSNDPLHVLINTFTLERFFPHNTHMQPHKQLHFQFTLQIHPHRALRCIVFSSGDPGVRFLIQGARYPY
jgi:hypothetical protein